MGKKLSEVDIFYLEHHKDENASTLARAIGCSERTVYNYLSKIKADARTPEGRAEIKGEPVPEPTPDTKDEDLPKNHFGQPIRIPPRGMTLIASKKHGTSSAVSMTKAASEVGDDIAKLPTQPSNDSYIFKMKKQEPQ